VPRKCLTAVLATPAAVPLVVTPVSAAATRTVTVFYKPPPARNVHRRRNR